MIIDLNQPKYTFLKQGLCDYCLLRQIIKKQYEHCERYPEDIRVIRYLYGDYPEYGYGSKEVERFVRYVEHFLNALMWHPTTKREITNLHNGIYSYGNDAADKYFFKRLKERFDAINSEIINTLNKYYNFENDKITFSNYKIPEYFKQAVNKGIVKSRFNRDKFMNTRLYKAYLTNQYSLAYALDSYEIKTDQDFWDKYTLDNVAELFSNLEPNMSNLAGVEKHHEYGI